MMHLSDPEVYDDDDDEDWTYEYEDEEEAGPDIEPDTNFTVEIPGTSKEVEKVDLKGEKGVEKKTAIAPDELHYGDDEYGSDDDGSYSYVTGSYSSSSFEEIDGDVRADVVLDLGKGVEKKAEKDGTAVPPTQPKKQKTPPSDEVNKVPKKPPPPEHQPPKQEGAKKSGEEGAKAKEDGKKTQAAKGQKAPPAPAAPPKPTAKQAESGTAKKSAEDKAPAAPKAPPTAVPPKAEKTKTDASNQAQKKAPPATLPKPLSSQTGTKVAAGKGAKVESPKQAPAAPTSKKAEIGPAAQKAAPPNVAKAQAKSGEDGRTAAAKMASVSPKAPTPLPPRAQPAKSQPPMQASGSQPFSMPTYRPPPPPRISRPPARTRDQPLAKNLWEERTKSNPPPAVSNRQFQMPRNQSASPTKQMFQSAARGSGVSTLPTKAIFADRMRAFVQAERAAGITYPTLAISAIKPKPPPPKEAPPSQANLKPGTKKGVAVEEEKKPVVDTSKSDALARAFLARAKKLAAEMEGREASPPPPRPQSAPSSTRRVQQPLKPAPKPEVYKEVAPRVEKSVATPAPPQEPAKQKAKPTPPEKKAAKVPVDKATPKAAPKKDAQKKEVQKVAEKKAATKVAGKDKEAEKVKPAEKKKGEKKKEKKEEGEKPSDKREPAEKPKDEDKPETEEVGADQKEGEPKKEAEGENEVTAEDEEYTEVDEDEDYTEIDEEVDEEGDYTEIDEEVDEEEPTEKQPGEEKEDEAEVAEELEEPVEDGEGEEELAEENEESMDEEKGEQKKYKRRKGKRGKKGRKGKEKKRRKRRSEVEEDKAPTEPPPKRRWIPPPRTPPEPVPMPPVEKSLCEILKEELRDGITPVKRYAKKVHSSEILLPSVIPWENEAAMQTQAGMGAFGQRRDPRIRIEDGKFGQLVEGSLKSETVLPLFEHNSRNFASQKDQYITSFGAHRRNVENIVDHHEYESEPKVKLGETIIPRVFLPADSTQSDMTPFGTNRSQTTKVKYLEGMKPGCDSDSNTFISRQFKANSKENAGSHVMDRRRLIVQPIDGVGELKHHPITECIVPRLFCNDEIYKKSGSDFGAFRPLVSEAIGGYRMDYDEERLCKLIIPYQARHHVSTAPSLTS